MALQMAFDKMGGVDALAEWGRHNPEIFYALYARLATTEPPSALLDADAGEAPPRALQISDVDRAVVGPELRTQGETR